ncbi:MAG: hypothetical protein KJ968_04910, partial [Nanoarchaeota archaeon]|nr:hypothetical protein [Nanoarchaeota archaeon]
DCIPLPSDCHPMLCINKKYELNYKKPEICTEIFALEAAYKPEDCICVENKCVNKNLGRSFEEEGISLEEARKIAEESECRQGGGVWRTFPNTCGDSCAYRRNERVMCGMAFTDGCDCGENKCWNGKTCESI